MKEFNHELIKDIVECAETRRRLARIQDTVELMAPHNTSVTCFTEVSFNENDHGGIELSEYTYTGAPCFATLPRAARHYSSIPVFVVAGIQKQSFDSLEKDVLKEFFRWLAYDSPFSSAVHDCEVDYLNRTGYFTVHSLMDAKLTVGALIAARAAHEYPAVVVRWNDLKNKGFTADAAFILAHIIEVKDGQLLVGKIQSSHHAFNVNRMSMESVNRYLKGKPMKSKDNEYWKKGSSYRGVHALWGAELPSASPESIVKLISEMSKKVNPKVKANKWGAAPARPFTALDVCEALSLDIEEVLLDGFRGDNRRKITTKVSSHKPVSARTQRERMYSAHLVELEANAECMCEQCIPMYRKDFLKANPLSTFVVDKPVKEDKVGLNAAWAGLKDNVVFDIEAGGLEPEIAYDGERAANKARDFAMWYARGRKAFPAPKPLGGEPIEAENLPVDPFPVGWVDGGEIT